MNKRLETKLKNGEVQFLPIVSDELFYKKQSIKRLLRQLFSFTLRSSFSKQKNHL